MAVRTSPSLGRRAVRGARRRHWWRYALAFAGVLAAALFAVRMALPSYLRTYVNRALDRSPDYGGTCGQIDVHFWRGAYTIHDLEIVKKSHAIPVPFFKSERVDCSLNWNALLHGYARGKLIIEDAQLNFVDGPSIETTQTGADQPWLSIIDDLYPFRIDRADIHRSEIHFQAFHTQPPVDVSLTNVEGAIVNLTNIENKLDPLIAEVHATGDAMNSGRLELDMKLDPHAHRPEFELAVRLLDLDVTTLNAVTRAYGDFDFESGRFDFVIEASSKDGFLDGYAKPLFRNLKILSRRDFQTDDPLQLFWEALVGLVGELFKNQPRDQLGTRLTFQGDLDNPRTSIMEIVGNVLRNAFVRAYLPRLEGRTAPTAREGDTPE